MIRASIATTAAFFMLAGGFAALAQEPGDVEKGHALARMVCAECHSVEAREALSPNSNAPSFVSVANTSGMTAMALRIWMRSSHPTMPNIMLRNEDRDDAVAYILSLNTKSKAL